jgi:hypothetical protein
MIYFDLFFISYLGLKNNILVLSWSSVLQAPVFLSYNYIKISIKKIY